MFYFHFSGLPGAQNTILVTQKHSELKLFFGAWTATCLFCVLAMGFAMGGGPVGPMGPMGLMGPTGPMGPTWLMGHMGHMGHMVSMKPHGAHGAHVGPMKPTGPMGSMGPLGPMGGPMRIHVGVNQS